MSDKPTRCSICFGKFMRNHVPQAMQLPGEALRYTHKSCKAREEQRSNLRWPARAVYPPKDE